MNQPPPIPAPATIPATVRPWYVRFAGLWVLPVGVLGYLLVLSVMVGTDNINLFPTLLLIGALTAPLSVLLLAYGLGSRPPGRAGVVALTAVVGGIVGTTAAGFLEYATLRRMPFLGMLAVGVIEEAVKLIVPVVVFLIAHLRYPRMGVVLGIASGMGFAVLETMGYGLTALVASKGNVAAVDQILLLRGLLAPAGHVAWTGLTAAALWRIGEGGKRAGLTFVGAYLLAVLLHTLWDGTANFLVHVVIAAVSIAILVALLIASREHRGVRPAQ